jgi:hypothetical protein
MAPGFGGNTEKVRVAGIKFLTDFVEEIWIHKSKS